MSLAPVIGPKTAGELRAWLDENDQPPLPSKRDVEALMGLLAAVKRKRQTSEAEAGAALEQYWQGLRDVPLDDLRHAYDVLLKGSPWFPDISEIRTAAKGGPAAIFQRQRMIAESLIAKHNREWEPPVDVITPDEAAELRGLIEAATETVSS